MGKDQLISPLPETIDAIIMELKRSPDNSATFECSFMANGNPKRTIVGTFSVPKPKEGKLVFSYKKDTTDVKQPVTVLSTDYDQFAIIWLCVEHSDETIEGEDLILTIKLVLLLYIFFRIRVHFHACKRSAGCSSEGHSVYPEELE